jgi:hypothetical protein
MNFAEPRTWDPWSWPDNRDEIPRVWNKTTGKMEPIDRPIIMYSSDSENNWDKNSGFFPPLSGKDFLNAFLKGREEYSQSGTDIPSFGVSRIYEGGGGTGMEPYFNEQVSEAPRYIRIPPDLDSPAVDRWMQEHPGAGTRQTGPQDFLRNKPLMQQKYRGVGAFPA